MKKKLKKRSRIPKYPYGGDTTQINGMGANTAGLVGMGAGLGAGIADNLIPVDQQTGKNAVGKGITTGALSGAAAGAMFGPIGMGVGAAIGGVAGGIRGKKEKEGIQDEYAAKLEAEKQATYVGYEDQMNNDPYNYFKLGGMIPNATIEVEGKELETSKGKILKDFNKQPMHKDGGYTYEAKPNRTIIPTKWRARYLEGDKVTRTSIERNLVNDQAAREAEQATAFNSLYKRKLGGLTRKYATGGETLPYDPNKSYFGDQYDIVNGFGERPPLKTYMEENPNTQYSTTPDDFGYIPNKTLGQIPMSDNRTVSSIKTVTPYNSAGPKPEGNEFEFNANKAMQFAPIAYNLAQGLRKPEVLNEEEYQNPYEAQTRSLLARRTKQLGDRRIDFKPIEDQIRNDYQSSFGKMASGSKSSGQVLSLGTQFAGNRAQSIARAKMAAQQANLGYQGEAANALADEASTLGNLGAARAGIKLGIKDINDRNKGARNAFRTQTATDVGKYGAGATRDEIYQNMLEDMFTNYKYDSKTNKYTYKPS